MTFTEEQKKEIYNQINTFNKQPSDPTRKNSDSFAKAYLYVDEAIAKDRAKFVTYLIEEGCIEPPKKVIDLAFGSGSLTAHIILDNDFNVDEVVFNDKNTDKTNQLIALDTISKVTNEDFLESLSSSDQYDWVVFNPQIGGLYTHGEFNLDCGTKIQLSELPIEDFLKNELGFDFNFSVNTDESGKHITVASSDDNVNKSMMSGKLKKLNIWNYYDIFYRYKDTKQEGKQTNIVKFRKNLDSIVNDDHTVIFLGKEQHFKMLFADYPNVYRYMADDEALELFVATKSGGVKTTCFELLDEEFVVNESGKKSGSGNLELGSLEELMSGLNQSLLGFQGYAQQNPFGKVGEMNSKLSSRQVTSPNIDKNKQEESVVSQPDKVHEYDKNFYKNILLKGVPGTGKSRLLEKIIENKLNISKSDRDHHVLRVNIHSASSNADLMQGIAVSTCDGAITYDEKRGLIFDLICRACQYPNQPFVLVLEEIQENSLNELIGDLIYLIEPDKRANLSTISDSLTGNSFLDLIEQYVALNPDIQYVKIPNLVSLGEYRKMILPANLFVFCTSNYRDDKKIIEDNLLRRFEVIDLYPQAEVVKKYSASGVSEFLDHLNDRIIDVLNHEIHPDRFQIGHAIWLNIKDAPSFAKALYKTLVELKEIREIQPNDLEKIFSGLKGFKSSDTAIDPLIANVLNSFEPSNLIQMVKYLQSVAYSDLMSLIDNKDADKEVEIAEVSE